MAGRTPEPSHIWSIGPLINIPLKNQVGAVNANSPRKNMPRAGAAAGDMQGLGIRNYCKCCEKIVEPAEIVATYPNPNGGVVMFDKAEIEALGAEKDKTMTTVAFVPIPNVNSMALGASYWLRPMAKA